MPANLGGWTGLILLLVVILLFAAPKLPQLAKSLGQSATIFKKEIRKKDDDEPTTATPGTTATATGTATTPGTTATGSAQSANGEASDSTPAP